MPRRFFRKFAVKRHQVGDSWLLAPFQHLLHDTRLWGIRRRTAVPAFALGLFIAFMPFPGHIVMAVLVALSLRINIPVAVVASLVSNPLTMYPMFYGAYRLGLFGRGNHHHVALIVALTVATASIRIARRAGTANPDTAAYRQATVSATIKAPWWWLPRPNKPRSPAARR